ncbi:uncharacterized protein LOC128953802 [Oppia nitens]|uniref:uncharacterized protein LOC128953802 n=1 Tax=Oppia nitens TaxID=1686743 RepID=UPI0023DA9C57|nr:uncharacterized protein LOC128953802 [Oppia nitens]
MHLYSIRFTQNVTNSTTNTTTTTCNKRTNRQLDGIFARMYTFGNSGRNFPLNSIEAQVYCNETLDLIKNSDQYTKTCLKEYPKSLLSVLIKTVKTQTRQLCNSKTGKRLQELFHSADCINSAKDEIQKCINESVDILMAVKSMDDNQKLPILCCGNHRLQKCFHDQSLKINNCNEEKIETSLRFLDSIQGNMISILCTKYDDSNDTCDRLSYPRRPVNDTTKRYKSVVMPIIRVLDSIRDPRLRSL